MPIGTERSFFVWLHCYAHRLSCGSIAFSFLCLFDGRYERICEQGSNRGGYRRAAVCGIAFAAIRWRWWRMSGRYASAAERAIDFHVVAAWFFLCVAVECAPLLDGCFRCVMGIPHTVFAGYAGYVSLVCIKKTRRSMVALRVPIGFGRCTYGCRASARGRRGMGDTMGIAMAFGLFTVHRYHPFRLIGALRCCAFALCTNSITEGGRIVKGVLVSL